MSVFKQPTSTSLVSDGAECIMISKKFFQQNLSEDVAKKIRKEVVDSSFIKTINNYYYAHGSFCVGDLLM